MYLLVDSSNHLMLFIISLLKRSTVDRCFSPTLYFPKEVRLVPFLIIFLKCEVKMQMISHISFLSVSNPPKHSRFSEPQLKVLYITYVMKPIFFEDDTVVLHSLSKHFNTFHIRVCCFALIHSSSVIFEIFVYCIVLCPKPHGRISIDSKEMGDMFCYYKESCRKEQYTRDINVFTHAHIQKYQKAY